MDDDHSNLTSDHHEDGKQFHSAQPECRGIEEANCTSRFPFEEQADKLSTTS